MGMLGHDYWKNPATKRTVSDSWEEYFEYGYQVGASDPVIIYAYGRTSEEAWLKATEAAQKAKRKLEEVYFPDDVVPWVRHWRVRTPRHEEYRELIRGNAVPSNRSLDERTKDGFILPEPEPRST